MLVTIITFWTILFLIIYTYFGYPILMKFLSKVIKKHVKKANIQPFISIIIPVHNEGKIIKRKIKNTLDIDYPKERIEVIVISDNSNDQTHEIVEDFVKKNKQIKLIALPERGGKTIAQNEGIKASKGEILVFTDASSLISNDGISKLIRNFNDPSVACASTEDINVNQFGVDNTSGESNYVHFDIKLRRMESEANSLVGNSGCFYAVRKEFCLELPPYIIRDFATALYARQNGFRAVHEPEAKVFVTTLSDVSKEFKRKVRTVIGGITTLFYFYKLLNPFKYHLYSIQLTSHKLLRWLEPIFVIILFCCNLALIRVHPLYFITAILFGLLITLGIIGATISSIKRHWNFIKIIYFLTMSHIAILWAWVKYLSGDKMPVWKPSRS